jgi:heme-degrading monooxygenase HmoA
MTKIDKGTQVETMINTFTTTPETQQQVLDILLDTTERHIRHLPGFISANFHKSPDGTNVVNYAQWRSSDDWKRMLADPDASEHIGQVEAIAQANYNLYEVVETFSAAEAPEQSA